MWMWRHPTPLQVITTRAREGGPKEYMAKQIWPPETHSELIIYQGSPLFPIFRALTRSLHRHSFVSHGHSTPYPSSLTSVGLPRPALHLLPPSTSFWPYDTHTFFPHAQTISILSDLLNSLSIPALLHLFIPNSIHPWHSNQTSQTLHLKNIHVPSLSTSHNPCFCFVQRC